MHEITFTPMRRDAPVAASIAGDRLVVDGHKFELTAPRDCPWLAAPPERVGEGWRLVLILPHGPGAPPETRFPEPVLMTGDGPVPMPPFDPSGNKGAAYG